MLRAIYDAERISRADVARLTGLTRTSVSQLVGELLNVGLVSEVGRGPSSGGKAPIMVSVATDSRHVLGLDLGEESFRGATVDLRGRIKHSADLPLEGRDGQAAVKLVLQLIDQLQAHSQRPLLGIGIGAPGLIDSRSGIVRSAVNLDWADLALGSLIEERYGLPVALANDSQAAALAEYTFAANARAATRPGSMVVIRVGRGVGAGIILNGQLYQGDGSGAGEIGHTALMTDGQPCRCGSVGCLETVASLRAMVNAARQVAAHVRDEQQLLAALRAGEPAVAAVVRHAGEMLGLAIGALIGSLNVRRVVLVGPAVALGTTWLEAVRERARRSALPLLAQDTQIELGAERDDVLLGASALLLNNQLGLSLVRR